MKHRLKGLLALMLSLTMLLSMVVTASAETEPEPYPVSIGNEQLTSANISDYNGKVSFTPASGSDPAILTLNGFTGSSISIFEPLNLKLEGINTVNNSSGSGIEFTGADDPLEISGSGSLTVTGTDIGIAATSSGGEIVISGGTVTANGKSNGIYAKNSVTISGGIVTATASNGDGKGISGGNTITIGTDEGTTTPTVTVGCQTGLNAATVKILNGSTVNINADTNAINSTTLNMGSDNWYQWKGSDNQLHVSSNGDGHKLDKDKAYNTNTLTIEPITYTITKETATNGSFEVSAASAAAGAEITITPTANNGYGVDTITVTKANGGTVAVNNNKFTMPAEDVTVAVTFKSTTSPGGGTPGTVMPNPPVIIGPVNPTPDETIKTESAETFDSGIALSVAVTILSATGSAWLAKKKD